MLRFLPRLLLLHIKIGYQWRLILLDFAVLSIVVVEIIQYESAGLRLRTAFRLIPQVLSYNLLVNIGFFLFIGAFLVPILTAVILILGGSALRINRTKAHLRIIHVLSLLVLAFYLVLASAMQFASGHMLVGERKTYAFTSSLQSVSNFSTLSVIGLALGIFLVRPVFGWIVEKKRPALLQDYTARLYLADLGGDFYPKFAIGKTNFNSGAVAPEIRFVKRYAAYLAKRYQELLPGSADSANYLQQLLEECEIRLLGIVLEVPSNQQPRIEFFPSTSRAMEVALLRQAGAKKILLSPYEHPVESKIASWLNHIDGSIIRRLEFSAEDYQLEWTHQMEKLVDELLFQMSQSALPLIVIISEVSYATGLRIPLAQVLAKVFEQYQRSDLIVIVDGAHAVGNVRVNLDLDYDYYVFSTHKWLFAPDPCGVLLSAQRTTEALNPYDCSSARRISATTANVRSIAGLRASLELIDRISLNKIWERSKTLRAYLIAKISDKFEVVGSESGLEQSNMLAIRPRPGLRWDFDAQGLAGKFHYSKVSVQVISIDPANPWVRISVPYFAEFQQINKLWEALQSALSK